MRRLPWADVHEREREQEVILELCVISFFLFQKVLLLHCFFFFLLEPDVWDRGAKSQLQ